MWWPPTALLLVTVAPQSASWTIALAGAALAVIGTVTAAVNRFAARASTLAPVPVDPPAIPLDASLDTALDRLPNRRAA